MDYKDSHSSSTRSEVSVAQDQEYYDGDLNEDLYACLSEDFKFTGCFCHRSVEGSAPNPGLTIDELGLIGLPLNEREAQAIIAKANPATSAKDVWEIEPSLVAFANEEWEKFMVDVATSTVWTALGIAPYTAPPRCELNEVLLYQRGSHVLPREDTPKMPGSFATITVTLPSAFEGGQVHLSHSGRTEVLDVSQGSLLNTSVLAWYKGVTYEVEPITSGYCLALSYSLIHTSPDTPIPSPFTSGGAQALDDLRETLKRWNANKYKCIPSPPLFAYVLDNWYDKKELNRDARALQGKDASLVRHLRPILAELGFTMCLASLYRHEYGPGDDPRDSLDNRWRRANMRPGWDSDDDMNYDSSADEDVTMAEIEEVELSLSNLVRITGRKPVKLGRCEYELNEECLVPRNAFENEEADGHEYEGFSSSEGAGRYEQCKYLRYNKSALIIFRNVDEASVMMDLYGPTEVLKTLELTTAPTPGALQVLETVMSDDPDAEVIELALKHMVAWKDHDLWNKHVQLVTSIKEIKNALTRALEEFDFNLIRPGVETLVKRERDLSSAFQVIEEIAPVLYNSLDDHGAAWIEGLNRDIITSYTGGYLRDISTLLSVTEEGYGNLILSSVIPNTRNSDRSFDFHIAMAEAYLEHEETLDEATNRGEQAIVGTIARHALTTAIEELTEGLPSPPLATLSHRSYTLRRAQPDVPSRAAVLKGRIDRLVETCSSMGEEGLLPQIFNMAGAENHMEVLNVIRENVGLTNPWVQDLAMVALASYETPDISHVPLLSSIAIEINAGHVEKLITDKLGDKFDYETLVALAKSLHHGLASLNGSGQEASEETEATIRQTINHCVRSLIPKWRDTASGELACGLGDYSYTGPPYQTRSTVKVTRILEMVDLLLVIGDSSPITEVLASLRNSDVEEIHIPLVLRLKETLEKHGKTVLTEPFKPFFKKTLSLYLTIVLGAKTPPPTPLVVPDYEIGCGCKDCCDLDTWLRSGENEHHLRANQARRTHLQETIRQDRKLGRLVATWTEKARSPYTLVVNRSEEVVKELSWAKARQEAIAFVGKIANDEELRELMGERYEDAMAALASERPKVFKLRTTPPEERRPATASTSGSGGLTRPYSRFANLASDSGSGEQDETETETATGSKRKGKWSLIGGKLRRIS